MIEIENPRVRKLEFSGEEPSISVEHEIGVKGRTRGRASAGVRIRVRDAVRGIIRVPVRVADWVRVKTGFRGPHFGSGQFSRSMNGTPPEPLESGARQEASRSQQT
jgi:hypothetical protein